MRRSSAEVKAQSNTDVIGTACRETQQRDLVRYLLEWYGSDG